MVPRPQANRVGGPSKMVIELTDSYFAVKLHPTCCQLGPQDSLGAPKSPHDPSQSPQLGAKMVPRPLSLEIRWPQGSPTWNQEWVLGSFWALLGTNMAPRPSNLETRCLSDLRLGVKMAPRPFNLDARWPPGPSTWS